MYDKMELIGLTAMKPTRKLIDPEDYILYIFLLEIDSTQLLNCQRSI
jgi:hypothetical protein